MSEIIRPLLGGTDGFRGLATLEVGPGQMNAETVAGLTYSLVRGQIENGASCVTIIGRDTRPSGEGLEEAAVAGAMAADAEVLRLGIAPTPAILKTAQTEGAGVAVALTASHNNYLDNGWKGTYGEDKPVGAQVKDISDRYWTQVDSGLSIPLGGSLPAVRPELLERYQSAVVRDIEATFGERPLEGKIVVVDGANGAAKDTTPEILESLGATVERFSCGGKGNINDGCGAADLSGVEDFLRARPDLVQNPNFIGAVAQDGDADRMMAVGAVTDTSGKMMFSHLEGNRVMELQAQGQPGIVGTDYTNDQMIHRIRERGIGFEFCENGDANVTAMLRETGWTRGGEFTGHHVDLAWLSSGDGVRMAAWLASTAAKEGTTFAAMAESMPLWHTEMAKIKVAGHLGSTILNHPSVVETIDRVNAALAGIGRTHNRASGTEAGVIRIWAVGQEPHLIKSGVTDIAKAVELAAAA